MDSFVVDNSLKIMEIESFINNLENLFDKKGGLSPSSVFFGNIEWSSFNQLLLVNFINEEYGVKMNTRDLDPLFTIEDLYKKIREKTEKKQDK